MTTQIRPDLTAPVPEAIPPLRAGDRLTRDEFERRYYAMPEINKAELLDGVVYMPSPVSADHGDTHFDLIGFLSHYRFATPGVAGGDNGTIRIDPTSEPQPDIHLRILPDYGGQTRLSTNRLIEGSPELVAEIAVSSIPIDLNVKLPIYQRNGVQEYILWRVPDQAVDWFVLRDDRYERLPLTADGVYKSEVFPGLWLAPHALVRWNATVLIQVAQQGLASPEHANFVCRLRNHFEANNP